MEEHGAQTSLSLGPGTPKVPEFSFPLRSEELNLALTEVWALHSVPGYTGQSDNVMGGRINWPRGLEIAIRYVGD